MWWIAPLLLALLAFLPDAACAQGSSDTNTRTEAEKLILGQRIYREGILPSGKPLQGVAQANVLRVGTDAACVTCHRRSGYGSSEGTLEIRSVTGPALFGKHDVRPVAPESGTNGTRRASTNNPADSASATTRALRESRIAAFYGKRQRPPYDDVSLRRAINEGVDVTGRALNVGMPRYALDADDYASLLAYLKTLSVHFSPGVTDDKFHFATVIQPGIDAAKRRALFEILQAYINDRNTGMRSEVRKHLAGSVRLGRTYREWVLHVWELSGPSESWGKQLEAYYSRQPVFALISGLGNTSWRPIHDFSERFEVPCIFPQTDLPVVEGQGIYTVYLSKGITLEAAALAKFLQDRGERGPVTQVFRRDETGGIASDTFRKAWKAKGGTHLKERVLDGAPDKAFWQDLWNASAHSTLILWLSPKDLAGAQELVATESKVKFIYLSSTLLADDSSALITVPDRRVRLVYPQDLPEARQQRLLSVKSWLRTNGIALSDERLQMNAYLAMMITAGEISHAMDTFSRDFLLERIEHRVGNAFDPSLYPHLSLGPGQRFASKGSYIVDAASAGTPLNRVSDWIVP